MDYRTLIFSSDLVYKCSKNVQIIFPATHDRKERVCFLPNKSLILTEENQFTKIQIPVELYHKKHISLTYCSRIWTKDGAI